MPLKRYNCFKKSEILIIFFVNIVYILKFDESKN